MICPQISVISALPGNIATPIRNVVAYGTCRWDFKPVGSISCVALRAVNFSNRVTGNAMISAIEIKHFRGFKHLKLDGLRTINIIVGPSAAGKTSLLEGLRLAMGATPQTAFNLAHRGMPNPFIPNLTRDQFEFLWTPLFFDFDVTTPIHFSAVDQDDRVARLAILFDQSKALPAAQPSLPLSGTSPRSSSGQPSVQPIIAPLAFKRRWPEIWLG